MQCGDDSVFVPVAHDEACTLAEGLCRDYVCYRLKRSGYERQVHVTHLEPAGDHALSNRILNLGNYMLHVNCEFLLPTVFH